jgi:hypothetical protein
MPDPVLRTNLIPRRQNFMLPSLSSGNIYAERVEIWILSEIAEFSLPLLSLLVRITIGDHQ